MNIYFSIAIYLKKGGVLVGLNILEIEKLNSGYGKSQVLFDVSLTIKEKSICALLGPNGSGKSTLMKSVFGLTNIYSGSIKFNGEEITKKKPHERVRLGLVYLPQVDNVYDYLTIKENLIMAGSILSKEERVHRIEEVIEFHPLLKRYFNRKLITLSGGERQIVAIAMALMLKPKMILFDEPSAHLAPKFAEEIFEKIKELNRMGVTVLLVEQNVKKALEESEYAYIMVSGRVIYSGETSELRNSPEFSKIFLGITKSVTTSLAS